MLSELLIAFLVLILGGYWFRYNCLSILRIRISEERARQVAEANDLSFPAISAELKSSDGTPVLDAWNDGLLRDYQVLTCLLRYTAYASPTVELRMLMLDFQLMQWEFRLTRRFMAGTARRALSESVNILEHLANVMGTRAVVVHSVKG